MRAVVKRCHNLVVGVRAQLAPTPAIVSARLRRVAVRKRYYFFALAQIENFSAVRVFIKRHLVRVFAVYDFAAVIGKGVGYFFVIALFAEIKLRAGGNYFTHFFILIRPRNDYGVSRAQAALLLGITALCRKVQRLRRKVLFYSRFHAPVRSFHCFRDFRAVFRAV